MLILQRNSGQSIRIGSVSVDRPEIYDLKHQQNSQVDSSV